MISPDMIPWVLGGAAVLAGLIFKNRKSKKRDDYEGSVTDIIVPTGKQDKDHH